MNTIFVRKISTKLNVMQLKSILLITLYKNFDSIQKILRTHNNAFFDGFILLFLSSLCVSELVSTIAK